MRAESANETVSRVAALTGFSTRKISIDDRECEDGACTECWFTVCDRHYWTDFNDFDFD